MDPVTAHVTIDRPREEVFEYLADIANHPEFSDHFLKEWRLTRVESYGRGAGARFKIDAPLDRYGWGDMTFIEVERAAPDRRRGPRREVQPQQDLDDLDAARPPGTRPRSRSRPSPSPRCRRTSSWRPSRAGAAGQAPAWARRCSRMQSILEEDIDRGARATVGGL